MDDASHDGAGFHRWSPHFFVPPTNNDSTIESRSLSLSIVGWLCYDCAINVENHVPVCVRERAFKSPGRRYTHVFEMGAA